MPHVQAALPDLIVELESVLDLLLRWAVLRFLEERQQAVVRVQALAAELLAALGARGYQATDNEANVFLPCLCEKVGHNQERVRGGYVKLLSLFRAVYTPHRFIVFLLEVPLPPCRPCRCGRWCSHTAAGPFPAQTSCETACLIQQCLLWKCLIVACVHLQSAVKHIGIRRELWCVGCRSQPRSYGARFASHW